MRWTWAKPFYTNNPAWKFPRQDAQLQLLTSFLWMDLVRQIQVSPPHFIYNFKPEELEVT